MVNATNAAGFSNADVGIELTVKKNGDVDMDDVVYLGCYALGMPGYDLTSESQMLMVAVLSTCSMRYTWYHI